MQVTQVEKHEDNSATVIGELTPEQLLFVVNLGLNILSRAGAQRISENQTKMEPSIVTGK